MRVVLLLLAGALAAAAQTACPQTPIYSRCEIRFDLNAGEDAESAQLHIEFRSPRHRTFLMPAFADGTALVVRFAPVDPGDWEYRMTSSIARFNGKQGTFTATAADHPGFIAPANGHHWRYTESLKAHLWMGDTSYRMAWLPPDVFTKTIDSRAAQKFTHIRALATGRDPAFYRRLDECIAYANSKGLIVDLILGEDENWLAKLFPTWQERERYLRYIVARYAAFNVTWQLVQEFEEYENGRTLMKELGLALKKLDPYNHPRTTHTVATSAPLLPDGWMDYVLYQTSDNNLGSVEHQLYAVPFVNAEFGYENSGAGASHPHHVNSDEFRRRLWNSFMDGQYPTFGNTGTYGGAKVPQDPKYLDSPGAKGMTVWFDLISTTRYWELEPYFDLDGGRCMAVAGIELDEERKTEAVEYIVYVEKPKGPIEIRLQRRTYDVKWINPITGEVIPQKDFKADKYTATPPTTDHDWVLHISREDRKEGMLRSYKFESRPLLMQEVEAASARVPFEIAEPAKDEISMANPPKFAAKLKRESRATRTMRYVWTAEVTAEAQGYRVIGSGAEGTLQPAGLRAKSLPATVNMRVYGLNANGKLYAVDRIYQLVQ